MIGFDNNIPLSKEEIYELEKKFYNNMLTQTALKSDNFSYQDILNRKTSFYIDKDFNLPQNIFFVKLSNNITLFGRKILSILHRTGQLTSLNCSRIDNNMIIGILKDYKYDSPNILIEYFPLMDIERNYIYDNIKYNKNIDISFPFTYYDYYTKQEKTSPKEGWHYYENLDIYLARGEKHIRKETLNWLRSQAVERNSVIYDPACSTGNFLYEIKQNYPNVFTIGGDLSKEMMEVASSKVDLALCEDALNSTVLENSVDYLFLRFLNFRVVTKKQALLIYKELLKKVKENGKIICFGHTPVLLKQSDLLTSDVSLESSSAFDSEYNSMFQYYILSKKR